MLAPLARVALRLGQRRRERVPVVAEEGRVACEFTLEATTARGRAYRNEYHFVFEVDAGRIRAVREYLDTHYAHLAFHSEE